MMDKFIDAIKKELSWAEQKHPFFAHVPGWGCLDKEGVDEALQARRDYLKLQIEQGRVTGFSVLMCEMWEAEEAIHNGDYDAALKELAQCGAVVLRNMELVQKMKNSKEKRERVKGAGNEL